uniref:DDB1-and CUL4-associated factor 10 n=1 Tax=Lygus hesperus TaxID=30085 RepID=A0A0A9XYZ1_LYGHE
MYQCMHISVQHVRSLNSVGPSLFLASLGDNKISLYGYNDSDGEGNLQEPPFVIPAVSQWHTSNTTDQKCSPHDPTKVLSAAENGELAVIDLAVGLERETNTLQSTFFHYRVPQSVAWDATNSLQMYISTNSTVRNANQSYVELYDLRCSIRPNAPALLYTSNRLHCMTVCSLDSHYTLVGYEGGDLRLLDNRRFSKEVIKVWDPYVSTIGDIEYNRNSDSFITSGIGDFTVWKCQSLKWGQVHPNTTHNRFCSSNTTSPSSDYTSISVWSHSHPSSNRLRNTSALIYNATFWSHDEIFVTDSLGRASVYEQDFNRYNNTSP